MKKELLYRNFKHTMPNVGKYRKYIVRVLIENRSRELFDAY